MKRSFKVEENKKKKHVWDHFAEDSTKNDKHPLEISTDERQQQAAGLEGPELIQLEWDEWDVCACACGCVGVWEICAAAEQA